MLHDGKIKSQETETIFCSPSAWAMHCKRIINPDKKSGCGWASVKYKGKKLDVYKAQWLRKCQLQRESTPSDGKFFRLFIFHRFVFKCLTHIFLLKILDEHDNEQNKKEMSPELTIKRIVLPHNTISNRNVMQ